MGTARCIWSNGDLLFGKVILIATLDYGREALAVHGAMPQLSM